MLTNRDLLSSNMKYEKLKKELNETFNLLTDDVICLRENIAKLSNEISTKESQIVIFQNLNDKYINENKILKSKIEKIWTEIENVDDFCKDLNRFNKD